MAERGSGKAVGYMRGRLWKGKWAPDARLQRNRIAEYAEENEYEVIKYGGEQQKFSLGRKTGFKVLMELAELCNKHKATFLYVDIGNWRPNVVLNSFLEQAERLKKIRDWKFVAIPPDRKIMEAIERQARLEKFESRRRPIKKIIKKKKEKPSPIEKWKTKFKIGRRRLKGFEHLYHGVEPIYRVIEKILEETPKLTNKRIAWALDREAYLTVDGKRWTDETVRKIRGVIKEEEFREFVHLKDRDKEIKFDI
ncbi:MAG: hypothetical protein H8E36_09885 [Rhodospirillaceae bacterium]|nr:hypothetical protein [Rhodospirillaceae bacterium]MBL6930700.1 hypothetical protein [Rhodospirillales bacterium]MBL6940522.1 hypothetical protein [Rhodospirillales bacterium]